ncbi:MAG: site-specific integrase [Pseudomonadota bacterium]
MPSAKLTKSSIERLANAGRQRLHNSLQKTPYEAKRTLALLSKMFSLAIRWDMRTDNPALGIEKFQEQKRQRWLSDRELKRLLSALENHPNQVAADAIRLQLLNGAKIGEVLSARWDDFDFDRSVWIKPSHHTKPKRTEHLPLSSASVALVDRMANVRREKSNHVFPSARVEGPIRDLQAFWRAVTKAADLQDFRIHDNRHTHASHLISSGMSLAIVGRLLGHTNPSTTQRYAHLADDPLRVAADVMAAKISGS